MVIFLPIKTLKLSKRGQMVRRFLGKVSRKSGNCLIPEMRTIQQKASEIPGGKSNGTEISGKKFPKISVYLERLFSFLGKDASRTAVTLLSMQRDSNEDSNGKTNLFSSQQQQWSMMMQGQFKCENLMKADADGSVRILVLENISNHSFSQNTPFYPEQKNH